MRSTLLLGSLLGVVLFISATPTHSGPAPRDDAHFFPRYIFPSGLTLSYKGCRELGGLHHQETPEGGIEEITVEHCINTCVMAHYLQAGVGNQQCFCDNDTDGGNHLSNSSCEVSTCLGDEEEFCGSTTSMVFYST